jgi:hypothetical protein
MEKEKGAEQMTPEEIELWKYAVDEICRAWGIGAIAIAIGISCISIKNVFNKEQSK